MDPRDSSFDSNPFGSLAIWREKVTGDVSEATGPEARLAILLEQSKDVEEAVDGCLRDSLVELAESEAWGLLQQAFASTQRQHLYSAAAQELSRNKQHCVELAREHSLLEEYAAQIKARIHSTVDDYERLGDLRFGLNVWKANLRIDCSLACDPLEVAKLVEAGYFDALRLIRRCTTSSQRFWAAQAAQSAPSAEDRRAVQRAAVEKAQKMLLEVAQQHGVDMSVPALFARASDPEAVPPSEEGQGEGGGAPSSRLNESPIFKPPKLAAGEPFKPDSRLGGNASLSDLA